MNFLKKMTRINAGLRPIQLCDSHLFAEYRELKRIPNTISSGRAIVKDLPTQFTLGTGHVKWFYNKLKYLHLRSDELYQELIKRGYNVEDYSSCFINLPKYLYNDWDDSKGKDILVERITERLQGMKDIKYNHEPISTELAIIKLKSL